MSLKVEECILLRLYMIKHDNHVTLLATIYSRANTTYVLFSQHVSVAMRHHQVKPNTIHQITSRYQTATQTTIKLKHTYKNS
jgi:hypothetical protein